MTDQENGENIQEGKGRSTWLQTVSLIVKWGWLTAMVVLSAFAGVIFYNRFFPPPQPPSTTEIDAMISQAMASATPPAAFSSTVYQTILPSLVLIQVQDNSAVEEGFGIGSGVIINENAHILTALHVVTDTVKIIIYYTDGSQTTAEIVAAEPDNDIAILQPLVPPEVIVPAVLGNPRTMQVGDEAYAVGNPLGLAASLSAGVISGFDRTITVNDGEQQLEGLIQFDTAVNPGNSGGPLLNRQGHVVGIVTALANPSDQDFFTGIGFAVPIGTAVSVGGGGPGY